MVSKFAIHSQQKGVFQKSFPASSMNKRAGFWKDFLEALFQCLSATYYNQKKEEQGKGTH